MQERFNLSDKQINQDLLHFVLKTPLWFWLVALALGGLVTLMLVAIGYMIYIGLEVTGMDRPVFWAFFITNFVYWIGISHAGVMISAILRLTQAEWRRPLSRMAEVLTVFSLATAGIMALIHTGRPWRTAYWLFPYDFARGIYPNVRSPLIWDLSAVLTYLIASSLVVYLGLVPDLALARNQAHGWRRGLYSVLSLGFRGTTRQWRVHGLGSVLLAALVLSVFVSVHSIVSWDFGMALVPSWHSTVFAPYFVIGAMHSGIAGVALMMAVFRGALHLEKYITPDHFDTIGRLMIAVASTWIFFYFLDFLFSLVTQEQQQLAVWQLRLFTWPNNLMMLVFIFCALLIPLPLWIIRRYRRSPTIMLWTAFLVQVGMWIERFMIIAPGLQDKQSLTFNWGSYQPSVVELSIVVGSFALVALGVLVFAKIFPIIPIFVQKEGQIVKAQIDIGQREVPAVIRE